MTFLKKRKTALIRRLKKNGLMQIVAHDFQFKRVIKTEVLISTVI